MKQIRSPRIGLTAIGCLWACAASAVNPPALVAQQPPEQPLQQHLDPARLHNVRDSFVVMLQGKESGWQRLTATMRGTELHLGDAITLSGMVRQESASVLDGNLRQSSLRQEGEMRQVPMKISLDFTDGRVTGSALTPSGGAVAVPIDATVNPTVLDDNAITPLLVGVRWRDSLTFAFPVLASGKGTTDIWSVRVLGQETITVPAGEFDTWKVEMQSGQSRSIVHVTRSAPYRMVRMQNGPAFEVVLVNRQSPK
jgi:hypothetical protein